MVDDCVLTAFTLALAPVTSVAAHSITLVIVARAVLVVDLVHRDQRNTLHLAQHHGRLVRGQIQ